MANADELAAILTELKALKASLEDSTRRRRIRRRNRRLRRHHAAKLAMAKAQAASPRQGLALTRPKKLVGGSGGARCPRSGDFALTSAGLGRGTTTGPIQKRPRQLTPKLVVKLQVKPRAKGNAMQTPTQEGGRGGMKALRAGFGLLSLGGGRVEVKEEEEEEDDKVEMMEMEW
ncbi:MAG: hypothetical protein M1826_000335 [Phylliscum demangeonii]|nr:MAG: hypothetical protein M1826_000335 [Phylliscum demangeonii]